MARQRRPVLPIGPATGRNCLTSFPFRHKSDIPSIRSPQRSDIMLKRAVCLGIFALSVAAFAAGIGTSGEKTKGKENKDPKYNNPTFVPTADEVIEKMFEMAKVNEKDMIFDLGCGDNRICFMAAKKYGCRGVGLELNPVRIREAMELWEKKYSDLKLLVET